MSFVLGDGFHHTPIIPEAPLRLHFLPEAGKRDDRYQGGVIRLSHVVHLTADQPEKASEELDSALSRWPRQHNYHQHWGALMARVEIDFYCGRGRAAWELLAKEWGRLRRTRLMYVQYVKIVTRHHRACAALVFAEERDLQMSEYRRFLRSAERDAGRIERERVPWGTGLALLVRAGVAAQRGNAREAVRLLLAAEAKLESMHMALYAAAARRRRGELTGGDEGRALIAEADAVMARQEVRKTARPAAMLRRACRYPSPACNLFS